MEDYAGNARKQKADKETKPVKAKSVEQVTSGKVIVQKKSLGRKIKDMFVEADLKSAARYVVGEVMIPAARNLIVEASTKGIERMIYGETATRGRSRYGPGSRITYNSSPISRPYGGVSQSRYSPTPERTSRQRQSQDDFILTSRQEADLVLERMIDIIDNFGVVTLGDLYELIGLPASHVDEKWGWISLGDAQIRQVREGFILDIPPAEPLQ